MAPRRSNKLSVSGPILLLFALVGSAVVTGASASDPQSGVNVRDLDVTDEGRAPSASAAAAKCTQKGAGWRLASIAELRAMMLSCNDPTNQACQAADGAPSSARCNGCGRHRGPYQGAGTKGCYLDLDVYPGGCHAFWSSSEVEGGQSHWAVDYATGDVGPASGGQRGVKCVKPKSGAAPPPPPETATPPTGKAPAREDWDDPPGDPSQGEVCVGHYGDVETCCRRKGKRLPTLDELKALLDGCNPPPGHECSPGGNRSRNDGCYLASGYRPFKEYDCTKSEAIHTYWAKDPTPAARPAGAPFVNVATGYASAREQPYTEVRVGRCVK